LGDVTTKYDNCTIDGIVISPGPGRPERSEDIGVCLEAIDKNPNLPILGVCLGHQALGHYYDASVTLAPWGPVHGLTSKVWYTDDTINNTSTTTDDGDDSTTTPISTTTFNNTATDTVGGREGGGDDDGTTSQRSTLKCNLFEGIPQYFDAVRYHSLTVQLPLSSSSSILESEVEPIAWCQGNALLNNDINDNDGPDHSTNMHTDSGVDASSASCVMALRHKVNPHYGVQFHPESVGTGEVGYKLLANFCSFCSEWRRREFSDGDGVGVGVSVMDDVSSSLTDIDSNVEGAAGDNVIDDAIIQIADGTGSDDSANRIVRETKTTTTKTTIDSSTSHQHRTNNTITYDNENHTPALPFEKDSTDTTNAHISTEDTDTSSSSSKEENVKKDGMIPSRYKVFIHKMDFSSTSSPLTPTAAPPSPETVFERIYASMDTSFWLDSSTGRRDGDTDVGKVVSSFTMPNGTESNMEMDGEGDSSSTSCPITSNSRFSIMGGDDGPLFRKIEYFGGDHVPERRGLFVSHNNATIDASCLDYDEGGGGMRFEENAVVDDIIDVGGDIISYLQRETLQNGKDPIVHLIDDLNSSLSSNDSDMNTEVDSSPALPFNYVGGYVGYLGYEVRHDTRVTNTGDENNNIDDDNRGGRTSSNTDNTIDDTTKEKLRRPSSDPNVPTAAFVFADRSLVYDHWRGDWYILAVTTNSNNANVDAGIDSTTVAGADDNDDVVEWMRVIAKEIQAAAISTLQHDESTEREGEGPVGVKSELLHNNEDYDDRISTVDFKLDRSKDRYTADIARCHEEIRNGESYELCLTNRLHAQVTFPTTATTTLGVGVVSGSGDEDDNGTMEDDNAIQGQSSSPFGLYKILRRKNPAPFAAFMKLESSSSSQHHRGRGSVSICCSSPERFLSINAADNDPDTTSINRKSSNGNRGTQQQTHSKLNHGWSFAPPSSILPHPITTNHNTKSITTSSSSSSNNNTNNNTNNNIMTIESKPIKGTSSRILSDEMMDAVVAESLRSSVKDRAENLMIVDLLRNDLSQVCEGGSVHVPRLMQIESFATVHQLVSTIRGTLDRSKSNAIDAIAACFPGGSMTGAPKIRSVDILDEMEMGSSRGPYSGCLGYVSLNGCADMNILIRTAVVTPSLESESESESESVGDEGDRVGESGRLLSWNISIGAGGAITALSDSEDEFDEMMLKARAVTDSVREWSLLSSSSTLKGAGGDQS